MTFEFVIAYRKEEGIDIESVLIEVLSKVLEDNLNEFEPEALAGMVRLRHERVGDEAQEEDGRTARHMLLGFGLDLPNAIEQVGTVIDEFASGLLEGSQIFNVVKFEDPLMRTDLAGYADAIFRLEMKLRRVLTLIYLHANQGPDEPYDLLRDEAVQPLGKEKVKPEEMRAVVENQFFHLTFGQYVGLNERPEVRLSGLLGVIRDSETYEVFRSELVKSPVKNEEDAVLLAGLKERMNAIESMRNCVAHNRRPSRRTIENYDNAAPLLDQMLEEYLAKWEIQTDT